MNAAHILRVVTVAGAMVLAIPPAWAAENCSSIRLDEPGGPLYAIPVANQRSAPACRYYTAVELIQAALFYQNPDSPRMSWVSLFANGAQNSGNPGNFANLVKTSKGNGVCTSRAVERMVQESAFSWKEAADIRTSILGISDLPFKATEACDGIPQEDFAERQTAWILSTLTGANGFGRNNLREKLERACKNNFVNISDVGEVEYTFGYSFPDQTARMEAFHRHVEKSLTAAKPVPVGIQYCADVLRKLEALGVESDSGKHTNQLCIDGLHASTVIGRRPKGEQCEYLIKNSWGTTCNGYDRRSECESGKIWVDRRALMRNVIFVQSLPAK